MKNTSFTVYIILIGLIAFASQNANAKNNSEVKPSASIIKEVKSFNVGVLKACTAEYDESDAIVEYLAQSKEK